MRRSSSRCCDPLLRKALRVSMGGSLRVPFARARDWPGDLEVLRDRGYAILALDPSREAAAIDVLELRARRSGLGRRIVLVAGAEAPGLSEAVLSLATLRLRIAMAPGVDSLNVATSVAIALHQLS